ncbi:MAG: class I SAM-dependent methyltransferase [Syntrophomonadaceae bacterium]|jgi:trans-aconitate 2-methyltransferase
MENFEFDGDKYNKGSRHQKEWGAKLVTELPLKGDERILDLGCGDGVVTKQLADRVPHGEVIGIDASEGMLKVAQNLEADNLSFILLDINELDFQEEFDLIFSNATLHWVKDHHRLLRNCYMALKPGGMLRFNFAGDGNCSNFYEVIKEIMQLEPYREYFVDFAWPWFMPGIEEYEQLTKVSRFNRIQVWEENADRFFKDADEMIKWIDQPSIVPFIRLVKEHQKEHFRREVIERMLVKTKQPDGTYFETFRRIDVIAYKLDKQ